MYFVFARVTPKPKPKLVNVCVSLAEPNVKSKAFFLGPTSVNIAFVYIAMNSASALILNGPHAPPAQAQRTVFVTFPGLAPVSSSWAV